MGLMQTFAAMTERTTEMGPIQTKPWTPMKPDVPPIDALVDIRPQAAVGSTRLHTAVALATMCHYIRMHVPFEATLQGAVWVTYDGAQLSDSYRSAEDCEHLVCCDDVRSSIAGITSVIQQIAAYVMDHAYQEAHAQIELERMQTPEIVEQEPIEDKPALSLEPLEAST